MNGTGELIGENAGLEMISKAECKVWIESGGQGFRMSEHAAPRFWSPEIRRFNPTFSNAPIQTEL